MGKASRKKWVKNGMRLANGMSPAEARAFAERRLQKMEGTSGVPDFSRMPPDEWQAFESANRGRGVVIMTNCSSGGHQIGTHIGPGVNAIIQNYADIGSHQGIENNGNDVILDKVVHIAPLLPEKGNK